MSITTQRRHIEPVDLGLRGTSFTKQLDVTTEEWRGLVFDQAENRMHTVKAVMVATAGPALRPAGS